MEEVVSLIFHGCMLVKGLEESLPNIANQPHFLMNACDEIGRVFGNVRAHLTSPVLEYGQHHHEAPDATDMVLHDGQLAFHQHDHGGRQSVEMDHVARSTLKQTRKRKHEVVRRTFRVRANVIRIRNTEVPPEDGYSWVKKKLSGRDCQGYYRCTHQKLNNCPAKKQVQRLYDDPYTFEVAYRGDHACTMSSTAASMSPPPPSEAMTVCSSLASKCLSQLLLKDVKELDIKESSGDLYDITHHCMRPYRNQPDIVNGSGSSSQANYFYCPRVTDLVGTLFSYDISNNNSINFIFSSEEKETMLEKE